MSEEEKGVTEQTAKKPTVTQHVFKAQEQVKMLLDEARYEHELAGKRMSRFLLSIAGLATAIAFFDKVRPEMLPRVEKLAIVAGLVLGLSTSLGVWAAHLAQSVYRAKLDALAKREHPSADVDKRVGLMGIVSALAIPLSVSAYCAVALSSNSAFFAAPVEPPKCENKSEQTCQP